jgi:2-keto-4-pentenoate hydratase
MEPESGWERETCGVSTEAAKGTAIPSPAAIAQVFVKARLRGAALPAFPGTLPPGLADAYSCQDAAIPLWPDEIAGWKIGLVPREFETVLGQQRLAGPIFRRSIKYAPASGAPTIFPAFVGGFAAVEAEFIFEIGEDVPSHKQSWTDTEALDVVADLRIGVELAGSPLATINALGPTAVISDFGNNAGLILGPSVIAWREEAPAGLVCETRIDGASVGRGNASSLPGGPIEALRWLLEHCARRGRPLRRGQLISSGAVTGVHDIAVGQMAIVDFGVHGRIACIAAAAAPT